MMKQLKKFQMKIQKKAIEQANEIHDKKDINMSVRNIIQAVKILNKEDF